MPDPLDALRTPVAPIDPDPRFAAELRARVERALSLPGGVAVSTSSTTDGIPSGAPRSVPVAADPAGVVPYIAVDDARRALAWYADALGARLHGEPLVMPDGRIGHAEFDVEGGTVMLSEAHPEIGVVAPVTGQGSAVTLHASVRDVDAVTDRAVAAGAALERPPGDNPYGRIAVIRDPFGHRWMLDTPVPPAAGSGRLQEGDIAYVSLHVPDADRAQRFFGDVLGWRFAGTGPARQVQDTRPPHGLTGGRPHSTLFLCFAVHDATAGVARVRAAGGTAEEPVDRPYGRVADCVDNQGTPFALYELRPGEPRPPVNGDRAGDLAYVTIEVADSATARGFYGAVLGWRFRPGRVSDGWDVDGVAPMTGMAGGRAPAITVPMYRVDDIAAAVRRVRAAGGTASDPSRQPYGSTAECTDDQGSRFYLGEL